MVVVLEGEMCVHLEDVSYNISQGDLVLIGPSQPHVVRNKSEQPSFLILQFEIERYIDPSAIIYYQYFSDALRPLSRINYIFKHSDIRERFLQCVQDIYLEVREKRIGYEIAVGSLIRHFLAMLIRCDTQGMFVVDRQYSELFKPVQHYVENHLDEAIRVKDMCKLINMSYHYFVKLFKKNMGMTFVDYVNSHKIKKAERLLLTTEMTIIDISNAVGMQNLKHFYTMFKRYNGHSPKQFRDIKHSLPQ